MQENRISKITRVPLRQVWKHEAKDFTTWLENNIDVLNDAIDVNLVSAEREQSTGNFNVDILAEDQSGNTVVIENQLECSDHDHLGKLITYLSAFEAKTAIWIVKDHKPEHLNAIAWLNETGLANFYLVKVEAIQIDDSQAAPLLTMITGPSAEAVTAGQTKQDRAERYSIRENFWSALLENAKDKTKLHSNISPGQYSWIGTTAGLSNGLSLNYSIRRNDAQAELYIDAGTDSDELNKKMFNELCEHKDTIEQKFGEELLWEALDGRRACRIRNIIKIGGYADEQTWPETHDAMVDSMIRLDRSLRPHIKS